MKTRFPSFVKLLKIFLNKNMKMKHKTTSVKLPPVQILSLLGSMLSTLHLVEEALSFLPALT